MDQLKLKPEIKAAWVEALRSGSYRQGRGQLKVPAEDGDRFCCLGVLCDLATREGLVEWRWEGRGVPKAVDVGFPNSIGSQTVLPLSVAGWAFENAENPMTVDPRVEVGNERYCLSILNDSGIDDTNEFGTVVKRPWTFAEIADVIEKQL